MEEEAAAPRKICSFMYNSSLKSWSSLSSLLAVVGILLHVQVKTDSLQESNKIYKPLQKIRYSYTRVGKSLKLCAERAKFHRLAN